LRLIGVSCYIGHIFDFLLVLRYLDSILQAELLRVVDFARNLEWSKVRAQGVRRIGYGFTMARVARHLSECKISEA
jgi:hypothetical protein